MKFYSGRAMIGTNEQVVEVSQLRTLVKFTGGDFAVRREHQLSKGPYLTLVQANVRMTVDIKGHDDPTTADYNIYRKATLRLPNTCIESAEHVVKCTHTNAHQAAPIPNKKGAKVTMSIPGLSWDIDQHDMNQKAFAAFPQGLGRTRIDAILGPFDPGDGMALVYSQDPTKRKEGEWKVHAVAVLLKSTYAFDPFLVVSEVFAPDDGSAVQMTADWDLEFFSDAIDFRAKYREGIGAKRYSLWKLSSAPLNVERSVPARAMNLHSCADYRDL